VDPITLLPFPNASVDPIERDVAEIDAALGLVARGLATRVRLVGLLRPEAAAETALAHAQEADVAFSLERETDGTVVLTVGPRH
jgi:hypothetical protein